MMTIVEREDSILEKTTIIFFSFTKPLLLSENTILQNITYNARLITLLDLQNNTYDTYNLGYSC